MTQEEVWKLIEQVGEEKAIALQQVADADKVKHYEAFFHESVLGHKSNYKDK